MSPCSCPPRGPQLFHSQVNFASQEHACKCTFDFHSYVTSLLSSSHSGRPATVAQTSFVVQSSCSCKLDTAIRCHTSCCTGRPLWTWFCSWAWFCSVSAQKLPQGATRPTGQGRTLLFPISFVAQVLTQLSPSLLPGATLLK